MIDRQHQEIIFKCDACPETLDTGADEWPSAQAEFRAQGWQAEKVGAEWTHLCPSCQGRRR